MPPIDAPAISPGDDELELDAAVGAEVAMPDVTEETARSSWVSRLEMAR